MKKYYWLILALLLIAAFFSFLFWLYQRDIKMLADFSAAYEVFNKTMADYSNGGTNGSEGAANAALNELSIQAAAFRISSLIKNDGTLRDTAHEIANLSAKEFTALKNLKQVYGSNNSAKELQDLTNQRKNAYARFQRLASE